MLQQLAHFMMARHLISLMWLEEMYSDDDDDTSLALRTLIRNHKGCAAFMDLLL